jgi:hypothetical protein
MEGFVSDISEKIIAKSECAGCKFQVAAKKRAAEQRGCKWLPRGFFLT